MKFEVQLRRRFLGFLSLGLFFIFFNLACTFSDFSQERNAEVVEKSKQKPPAWLNLSHNQLRWERNTATMLYKRESVFDLTLGLRQFEKASLAKFSLEVYRVLLSVHRHSNLDGASRFKKPLEANILTQLSKGLEVRDIYYERVSVLGQPGEGYFDLYFLMVLSPEVWFRLKRLVSL